MNKAFERKLKKHIRAMARIYHQQVVTAIIEVMSAQVETKPK